MSNIMQIQIRQTGASASEAVIRGHRVTVDRPIAKGGSDQGPMGGELFLAAVGGCFMSNLLAAIKGRGLQISGLEVSVAGEIAAAPDRFVALELGVAYETGDQETVEKLVEIADRACIMMNTLRGKLDIRFRVQTIPAVA
jgi:putative redox protein